MHNKLISRVLYSRPQLSLKDIMMAALSSRKFSSDAYFFKNGRSALLYGLEKISLPKKSNILLPAYICNSIPETLLAHGYCIIYQDILEDFQLDSEKLEENILKSNIKAVLLVAFFGMPIRSNEIYQVCKRHNVVIIEDHCHSFQSNNAFFKEINHSDFAIYSLRKNIPVKDAGAIRFNSKYIITNTKPRAIIKILNDLNPMPYLRTIFFVIIKIIEGVNSWLGIINPYSNDFKFIKDIMSTKPDQNDLKYLKVIKPSFLTKGFLANPRQLLERRNLILNNYSMIERQLKLQHFTTNIIASNPECVPQYFICKVEKEDTHSILRQHKIGANYWPGAELPKQVSNDADVFPIANKLNNEILLLPVNLRMKKKHISWMSKIFKKAAIS